MSGNSQSYIGKCKPKVFDRKPFNVKINYCAVCRQKYNKNYYQNITKRRVK